MKEHAYPRSFAYLRIASS